MKKTSLSKLDLLVPDELGYVPATKVGAELLFDVIATAYERSSVMVTTNLPFENWTEVLSSERLTGATLDRVAHRCKIIETKGESYRLQDAAKRSRARKSREKVAAATVLRQTWTSTTCCCFRCAFTLTATFFSCQGRFVVARSSWCDKRGRRGTRSGSRRAAIFR
jgi:hypothetical protein